MEWDKSDYRHGMNVIFGHLMTTVRKMYCLTSVRYANSSFSFITDWTIEDTINRMENLKCWTVMQKYTYF